MDNVKIAANFIGAQKAKKDVWIYYADETSEYYVVTLDELELLYELMIDPSTRADAYSHWCASTDNIIATQSQIKKAFG